MRDIPSRTILTPETMADAKETRTGSHRAETPEKDERDNSGRQVVARSFSRF